MMNAEQLSRVGEKLVKCWVGMMKLVKNVPETLLKLQGSLVSMSCFAKILVP